MPTIQSIKDQWGWWIGLVGAIAVALTHEATGLIPDNWSNVVQLVAIISTAITAYFIKRPE